MIGRKGVASLTTFSLIIVLFILVFLFVYSIYNSQKSESEILKAELENVNAVLSLRNQIRDMVMHNNSNLTYNNTFEDDDIQIILQDDVMIARQDLRNKRVEENISSVGISFCSTYTIYPSAEVKFQFGGSCVSVLS